MDEVLTLLKKWEKRFSLTLYITCAILLLVASFKLGYKKGFTDALQQIADYIQSQSAPMSKAPLGSDTLWRMGSGV